MGNIIIMHNVVYIMKLIYVNKTLNFLTNATITININKVEIAIDQNSINYVKNKGCGH